MGNPMNGDMYEGILRPGDVGIEKEAAEYFKKFAPHDRIADFQRMFREQGALAASDSGVTREMPRYKCHKEVWALKIAEVKPRMGRPTIAELEALLSHGPQPEQYILTPSGEVQTGGALIVPADDGFAPFDVDQDYMTRHNPQIGGYFVVYQDGYKSYSPQKPFEEGYARI